MPKFALVLAALDNLVLDNYNRKMQTYLELGWDQDHIHEFLSKKENIAGKIASFNTRTVSFTASSRRNRYYEVYNRPDMLEYDKLFPHVVEAITELSKNFKIYIICTRTEDMKYKTVEVMKSQGFPVDQTQIYFKKMHESIAIYRRNILEEIKSEYSSGIGIIINPNDENLISSIDYTPIGFTSIKEVSDFNGYLDFACLDWVQVKDSLANQG